MKKLIAILLTMAMLTGCGTSNIDNSVTVEALSTVEEAKEEPVVEETLQEEVTKEEVIIEEEIEEPEVIEVEEIEEEHKLTQYEKNALISAKEPKNFEKNTPTQAEKDEVRAEYERRKEEGYVYEPENIYSEYLECTDLELIEKLQEKFLELHNEERRKLGLNELKIDERLNKTAKIRAEEASYFFSHTRPNGEYCDTVIPWDGSSLQDCGENVSWAGRYEEDFSLGTLSENVSNAAFNWLCNSPTHYENIISPNYNYIGIYSYIVHHEDGVIEVYTAFEFCSGAMG